jgi:radical SAM superfamily enzyme YgiQ (UPF0313 family)
MGSDKRIPQTSEGVRGKVLLVSTNRCATPDPVFPLGLAHLNAALGQAGYLTRWLDGLAESQPLDNVLRDFQPHFVCLSLRNVDDVLIRKREIFYHDLASQVRLVRQVSRCPTALGGSGFSIFPEQLLRLSGADFGIQGEGEIALISLLHALARGTDYSAIPGLVYTHGGRVMINPPGRSRLDNALDLGDRPEELVSYYIKTSSMLNLQTQRGCAHACCYCTYPLIEGHQSRRRPPELVAEEMAQMQARGAPYVFIVDSIFNSSADHVSATCEAIIRRQVKLRWGCFLRPQGLTLELMKLMARAGLTHIEFGSDSFSDAVLQAYTKQFTFDDILQANEMAQQANIDHCHFLICGGPGETTETLEQGFRNSQKLTGAVIMAVVGMRIYPGTALHQRALREGCLSTDTDLLSPVYYLAPGLTTEGIFTRLQDFARRQPNWIAGDPAPAYGRLVERLRSRGVAGPLWSYLAMLQRIQPAIRT